jgi:hypothetical protein
MVPIERSWLAPEFLETTIDHEIGAAGGKVRAIRRSTWRELVLDEISVPVSGRWVPLVRPLVDG